MANLFLKSIDHGGSNNHSSQTECHRHYRNANNESRKTFATVESNFADNEEFEIHDSSIEFNV